MIGDRIMVNLGQPAFLGADASGEIAEMIHGQRQVGRHGLADRFAVVPGLGGGEQREVLLHPVGDPVQDQRALGGAGAAPGVLGGMGGVERTLHIRGARPRDGCDHLAVDRRGVVEIAPLDRLDPGAAYEIAVTRLEWRRACNDGFHDCHF